MRSATLPYAATTSHQRLLSTCGPVLKGRQARNHCWLLLLLLLAGGAVRAQGGGSVTGTLRDARTGEPLPFANVLLLHAPDSTLLVAGQTAEGGTFTFDKVLPGTYWVRVAALGYQPARQRIALTAARPNAPLGDWRVAPAAVQLGGVQVRGEKAALDDDLDKKVINVAQDLNGAGGTAADLLQKVPAVTIDQEGRASLRGNANVTIYLDGKPAPSTLRLDQLPASRLATIEVLTNPGAKYTAEGTGGIINLVQKKQSEAGWNGLAQLTLGTRAKYSGSLSLNRKVGRLNVFGSYDGLAYHFRGSSALQQVATAGGFTTRTDQTGSSRRAPANQGFRLGAEYALSPTQRLTLTGLLNTTKLRATEDFATLLTRDARTSLALQNQNFFNQDLQDTHATLDYHQTWAAHPGRELTASATYIDDRGPTQTGQRVVDGPPGYPRQERRQALTATSAITVAQLDYVHPLGEKGRWSTGIKLNALTTNGGVDYQVQAGSSPEFTRLDSLSNTYRYQQVVPAGYATFQQTQGSWSYQGGLRAEHTTVRADLVPAGTVRQQYLNFFPSATLTRTLPGEQRLRLSYSRRLNRPGFLQVMPLAFYSDARNYRVGNPALRPEYVQVAELGHQVSWQATSLTTTLFGRFTTQAIQGLRAIDTVATRLSGQPDFITRTSYLNLGRTASYGLETSLNLPITAWWKLLATGSFYRNEVTSYTGEGTRAAFNGAAYLLNTFTPTKTLDAQLSGNFRGPQLVPQGRIGAVYGVDMALRQRLWQERATLTFRVTDVFNTRRQRVQLDADGLAAAYQTKYETRVGYLTFTWFLGSKKPAGKIEDAPRGDG